MSSWSRGLPEHLRDLVGAHRAQLRDRPRPVGAEAVGQPARDREVAAHPVALAQRGKPARAEVHRGQREQERRGRVLVALDEVHLRVERRLGHLTGPRIGQRGQALVVDAHPPGVRHGVRGVRADLLGQRHGAAGYGATGARRSSTRRRP
jgi:hypothetical protein